MGGEDKLLVKFELTQGNIFTPKQRGASLMWGVKGLGGRELATSAKLPGQKL